jgi:DNA-binding NarL/FixJ family response regulator
MKKINVIYACATAEEYPGCADLLYSYSEVNLIALPNTLVGVEVGAALAKGDVLVVDESVLVREGLQVVQSVHNAYTGLNILLVYENTIDNNILEYLSAGVRGLIEHKSCVSLLRRAVPAVYAGEIWMPRRLVQSLKKQSINNGGSSVWDFHPSMIPGRGKIN